MLDLAENALEKCLHKICFLYCAEYLRRNCNCLVEATDSNGNILLLVASGTDTVILSTYYPLHANNGSGKREARIDWSMVIPDKAAPVTGTTLRTTGPVPPQLRDPITPGLTRRRLAVLVDILRTEIRRNPVSK